MKSANFSELMDIPHIGWMLMHSVWQASAIAAALWIAMFLLRSKSARLRYGLTCGAMVLALITPVITVWWTMPAVDRGVSGIDVIPVAQATSPKIVFVDALGMEIEQSPSSIREQIERHLPSIVKFWIACVVILSIRLGIGFGRTRAWKSDSYLIVDDRWTIPLKRVIVKMNLPRRVMLLQSMRVSVPMTMGWFSPVILIPASLASGLSPLQIQGILAHELAHIRRHDYLVNLIQTAIETLMFYHPAIGWMGSVMRQERENCCDDIASEIVGDSRSYAQTLTRIEELCHMKNELSLALTGGVLLPRIQRLLGKPPKRAFFNGQSTSAIALLAGLLVIGCVASREKTMATEALPAQAANPDTLSPGNRINLTLSGDPSVQGVQSDVQVSENGSITVTELGEVQVAGRTMSEVQRIIAGRFEVRGKQVAAHLTRFDGGQFVEVPASPAPPPKVNASGYAEARTTMTAQPPRIDRDGARIAVTEATIQQALAEAKIELAKEIVRSSPTSQPAGKALIERDIAMARKQAEIAKREYKVAELHKLGAEIQASEKVRIGAPTTTPPLEIRNAKLRVSNDQQYYISGGVPRIGVYSLNDRKVSVLQAIIAAGSDPTSMPDAEVQIIRRAGDDKEEVLKFSVKELLEKRDNITFVRTDDTILVKAPGIRQPAPTTQGAMLLPYKIHEELSAKQLELARLSQKFGPNHPQIIELQNEIQAWEVKGRADYTESPPTQPSN